jgi:hypothetical protein
MVIKAIKLLRTALWATPSSGVTHPAWRACAIDNADAEVATRGEALLGSYETVPSQWCRLQPPDRKIIVRLHIESDFRNAAGVSFAGFQAILIHEMRCIEADGG